MNMSRELIHEAARCSGAHPREVERTLAGLSQDAVLRERIVSALADLGLDRRHLDRVAVANKGGYPHNKPRGDGKPRE